MNHTNADVRAKGSIAGTYRIVRWFERSQDTLFFYVTSKHGNVWTVSEFMNLARRGGLKKLPVGFSVQVHDNNVIAVNGDKFARVKDAVTSRKVP